MPDYDAYEFLDRNPLERFPSWVLGLGIWREWGNAIPDTLQRILDELIRSRRAANWGQPPLKCPRVFVSHKQSDETRARDIANLARAQRWDLWLDVLDPALQFRRQAATVAEESLAVAAIIEMGLLNCTHVLAVLTPDAERSRWIPYEYGRVKDSSPYSLTAACWIDKRVTVAGVPEYFLLGPQTRSDSEITTWLQNEMAAWQSEHTGCGQTPGDQNDVDAAQAPGDKSLVSRDRIEDALKVFYKGLPYDLPITAPLHPSPRKRK